MQERRQAHSSDLPRHLRDADRSAQLIRPLRGRQRCRTDRKSVRSTTNQVSCAPSQTAVTGFTGCVRCSSAAIGAADARARPSGECYQNCPSPRAVPASRSASPACRHDPPEPTSCLPALVETMSLHIGKAVDRAAIDHGHHVAGCGTRRLPQRCSPEPYPPARRCSACRRSQKIPAKMTMARMKLASGPATTTAARLRDRLIEKAHRAFRRAHVRHAHSDRACWRRFRRRKTSR